MDRLYKFLIIAFVVGGLLLVFVFLYQDYTFKNSLSEMNANTKSKVVPEETKDNDIEDESVVITISNTDELSVGTFDSVESKAIIVNKDDTRVSFPVDSTYIILSCTDQELYQAEKWDSSQVTRNRKITLDQLPDLVKKGEPVIVTSLSDDKGVQKAYGVVVKSTTACRA